MNINNLMKGDWVFHKSLIPSSNGPLKIVEILSSRVRLGDGINRGSDFLENEEYIEPILLTSDIFKKNGFTELSTNEFHIVNIENNYMYWANGELYIATSDGEFEFGQDIYIKDCKYVHDLQHELNSLKLTKEISYESLVG